MYRETSYFYHRDGSYDITFAYRRSRDCVWFGAAFCNPKDQFSKVLGRKIAEGRMQSAANPNHISISPESTRFQVHDMLVEALNDYSASPALFMEYKDVI